MKEKKLKKKHSRQFVVSIILIFILSIIGLSFTYTELKLNPFEKIELINTSGVTMDSMKNLYIVSDSNRAISKISNQSQIAYQISGGNRREDSFYNANELAVDPAGNLYVLHHRWDETGSYLEVETISKFDINGNFVKILFELPDETESKLVPITKGLKYFNDHLYWFVLNEDKASLYSDESVDAPIFDFHFDQADKLIQDIDLIDLNTILFASKNGFIKKVDMTTLKETLLYDASIKPEDKMSSIWGIAVDQDHTLYFNDLGKFGVYKIGDTGVELAFSSNNYSELDNEVYYNFYVHNGNIVAVNDESITTRSADGTYHPIGTLNPSIEILIKRLIAFISLVALLLTLILIARWLKRDIFKSGFSPNVVRTMTIIFFIVLSTVIISTLAINFYNQILVTQSFNNLKMVVQNSKFVIDGDEIDSIEKPSDFNNEVYQKISDDLQKMINYNEETWNENLYTALYTIIDDRYYALMYNDYSITPFYTFNAWTDDDYFYYFYDAYQGAITEGTETDADGGWLFSMGPVYNSKGEIVAIIEVGMNKYIFEEWNANIVNKIVTDIISIIIIVVLLLSEITFFSNWMKDKKNQDNVDTFNDLNIIRTLALLLNVVIFMCIAFIPLLAKSIYEPIGNLSMNMAIGLPIFAEVLMTAASIIIAGYVAEKKGWRTIFYIGTLVLIGTAVATALTRSLVIFIIIRGIAGIGNGFIQMTMHAFANTSKSVEQRNETFANLVSGAIAGINLGVVFGANLADKIGYFNVFFVMAGVGVLSILFQIVYMRHYEGQEFELEETEEEFSQDHDPNEKPMTWLRFFTRKNIVFFIIFILVPASLCYMYLEYFFPLFAEAKGLTTSVIGIVFSLYGLFIVYFGPSISTFTEKMFGIKRASVVASILTGLSLMIFALTGSLIGAIFAVLILAVSDSFGEAVYTTYFLALKESRKIGQSIAAGYLEFSMQIGKMLGALAFGIAIGFGEQLGIGVIGIITMGFAILFMIVGTKYKDLSKKTTDV